jgi:hypothetical protein
MPSSLEVPTDNAARGDEFLWNSPTADGVVDD